MFNILWKDFWTTVSVDFCEDICNALTPESFRMCHGNGSLHSYLKQHWFVNAKERLRVNCEEYILLTTLP